MLRQQAHERRTQCTQWELWGGTAHLVVRAPRSGGTAQEGSDVLKTARAAVDSVLMAVDAACSRFRPDSEVAALAAAADGRPRPVSPMLAALLAGALRAAYASDGAVDPTLGLAMVAVGYDCDVSELGRHRAGPSLPDVRRRARWRDIQLDLVAGTVRTPPGVLLDLGATAKAMAADLAVERALAATGCPVLVSLCGDIAVAGNESGDPWLVRVLERPDDRDGPVIHIHDGGVATSTTRSRRWTFGGQSMHHLLDPVTGLPVREIWRTATVAAASCVDANTASTATIVKGAGGRAWLTATGLPGRLVGADGSVHGVNDWPLESLEQVS